MIATSNKYFHGDKVKHASELKDIVYKDIALKEYVDDILTIINDDVKQAGEEKKTMIVTELPSTFSLDVMDYQRARNHIYYHVICILKQAEYRPKLEIIKKENGEIDRVYLHLTWFSEEDVEYENHINKVLQSHIIKKQPSKPTRRRRKTRN
jgi:hypothetical protein